MHTAILEEQKVATRAYVALFIGVFATAWSAIFVRWAPIPGPPSAFYRVFLARWSGLLQDTGW